MDSAGAGLPAIPTRKRRRYRMRISWYRLSDWRPEPCTVTDFEVCKRHGLETVSPIRQRRARCGPFPHLWRDLRRHDGSLPESHHAHYVNPMAMKHRAMWRPQPSAYQTGRPVPFGTGNGGGRTGVTWPLSIPPSLRYRCAGINRHAGVYLELERKTLTGLMSILSWNCYGGLAFFWTGASPYSLGKATNAARTFRALRDVRAGLLRHRVIRAFCRVHTRRGLLNRDAKYLIARYKGAAG